MFKRDKLALIQGLRGWDPLARYQLRIEGGDPGGGGGGDDPPPKTFSQADLDHAIQQRVGKAERAATKKSEAAIAELRTGFDTQIAELNEKLETAGLDEQAKAKLELDKAERKRQEALDAATAKTTEAEGERDAFRSVLRTERVAGQLQRALSGKVLGEALEDALASFQRYAQLETDEETDAITNAMIAGEPHDMSEAVVKFLAAKPHFAPAPAGGTGLRGGNGAGGGGKPLSQRSAVELAVVGLQQRKGRTGP